MLIFRKSSLTAAAAVAVLTASSVARADTVTLTSRLNNTGLTATVGDHSPSGNTFTFTLTNTSVAPGPTSTVTNIGFDLPGERPNDYALVSSTNPSYFVVQDLNGGFISNNFDFVLMNRPHSPPNPLQYGVGSIASGIRPGQSAAFVITGDFSGLTADEIARSIFARFQNATPAGDDVVTAQTPSL